MQEDHARNAVQSLAFGAWLRSGSVPPDFLDLPCASDEGAIETKGNPYHDPKNGRFTFAPNGKRAYVGMTRQGLGVIRPIGGGGVDSNGHSRPEVFAPDPYALHSPDEALQHYREGSGEDRNYYFNNIDTSQLKLSDFPEMAKTVSNGKPGLYPIVDTIGSYNGGTLGKAENFTSAATVGGLVLRANGSLAIARDGRYSFSGTLSADPDKYDFNKREGRSPVGDASTAVGRQLSGKEYWVNMIGSKPYKVRGRR